MPVTLAKMAANEANINLAVGEDTLALTYYPNRLTAKSIAQLNNGADGLNQILSETIKSWDVLRDDGSMYPLDAESLSLLGVGFLLQVAKAIVGDISPN